MQFEWNRQTGVGTALVGVGALLDIIGFGKKDAASTLIGTSMIAGGGYLLYDELTEEDEDGEPPPPPPEELREPSVNIELIKR